MANHKRAIRRAAGVALIVTAGFGATACSQVDVNTEEGLNAALEKREKLDKAIPKILGMVTRPDEIQPYVPALIDLYVKGSMFDREVVQALASATASFADGTPLPSGFAGIEKVFEKAATSSDNKQIIQAAYGVKNTKNEAIQKTLIQSYDKQRSPEVKRAILETGLAITNSATSELAISVLSGKLEDIPFNLLKTSCDVLAVQKDPAATSTLMKVIYHQDGVGRTLSTNCTRALLALDKDTVAPELLKAYKLENEELQLYVKDHPDTVTNETVRNNTANALALYRYKEAVEPMLDYIGDTHTIPVPGTLAIRQNGDPAWAMWASLVGVAVQSSIFAVNDIGVQKNERAKQIFTDLFHWTTPFKAKFKHAIEQTGTTNIEVSQRVNAYRVLRENDLISNAETLELIESLKGDEFTDERKMRPWARASIGTDMVTYSAITSKSGDTTTVWAAFNAMKAAEFNVPTPEDPDAPKIPHANDNVYQRIDDVKPAFELADKCDTSAACYAEALKNPKISNYERIKAIYELGLSGNHEYFKVVCAQYKDLDVFGQLYGTKALAQLGTPDDVAAIEELNKNLANGAMNSISYQAAKPNLEGLITTLANKEK